MIYLDNAATSWPKPECVKQAISTALDTCGNPGRGGHHSSIVAGEILLECRIALAELLSAPDPMRFIYCLNCTDALNMAIKGMLQYGGHAVITSYAHNSSLRPLHALSHLQNVEYTLVLPNTDHQIDLDTYAATIRHDTRLCIINHVSNVTGQIQPVKELAAICKQKNVPLLIDCAQSAGHMKLSIEDIGADLYAFPGHKGLLGPQGIGLLYVGESCWPYPLRQGGTGSASSSLEQPIDLPDYYESGTPATHAIAGLLASVNYIIANQNNIYAACAKNRADLYQGLSKSDKIQVYADPHGSGAVSFNIPGIDSIQVAETLEKTYDIACRPGLHCAPLVHQHFATQYSGMIRLSPGPHNTQLEIDNTLKAIYAIAKQV